MSSRVDHTSDIGYSVADIFDFISDLGTGDVSIGAVFGVVFTIGAEVDSLVSTRSLAPSARVVDSTLWMFGPTNTLLAMGASIIAVGSTSCLLTVEEKTTAPNNLVCHGTLPGAERIVLTDIRARTSAP